MWHKISHGNTHLVKLSYQLLYIKEQTGHPQKDYSFSIFLLWIPLCAEVKIIGQQKPFSDGRNQLWPIPDLGSAQSILILNHLGCKCHDHVCCSKFFSFPASAILKGFVPLQPFQPHPSLQFMIFLLPTASEMRPVHHSVPYSPQTGQVFPSLPFESSQVIAAMQLKRYLPATAHVKCRRCRGRDKAL